MPIDPRILLGTQTANVGDTINTAGNVQGLLQQRQEAPIRQALLQGQADAIPLQQDATRANLDLQKAQTDAFRNDEKIKGAVFASVKGKQLLDANDIPGFVAMATDRIKNIQERGGDPTETANALQMVQSGDPSAIEKVKNLLQGDILAGQQYGIIKPGREATTEQQNLQSLGFMPGTKEYAAAFQRYYGKADPNVMTPYQQAQLGISQGQLDVARQNATNKPGQIVQTDQGTVIVDPRNSTSTPVLDQNGRAISGRAGALTESQGNATGFGMRASEANKILIDLGAQGVNTPSKIKDAVSSVPLLGAGLGAIANAAVASPQQQQAEQAQRDFVNAVLRKESGAAISNGEFDNAKRQYFPAIGDSKEVINQKRANRETAIDALRIQAGPGGKNIPANYSNKKGWVLHTDANGNKAYVSPDGKQYEEVANGV